MSSVVLVDRKGREWLNLSWVRAIVWASVLVPVGVAIAALVAAAPGTPVWPAGFVVLLGLLTVVLPDSSVGSMLCIGYVAWWIVAVPPGNLGWALVAALALLAFHTSVALAAAGPSGATVAGEVRLALGLRMLGIGAATTAVALVASALDGRYDAHVALVVGALLAVGALPVVLARRTST